MEVLLSVSVVAYCQQYRDDKVMVFNKGPRWHAAQLGQQVQDNVAAQARWCERAQVTALLGSCHKSHREFKSGLRMWDSFCKSLGLANNGLPPTSEKLVEWSVLFRLRPLWVDVTRLFRSCLRTGAKAHTGTIWRMSSSHVSWVACPQRPSTMTV